MMNKKGAVEDETLILIISSFVLVVTLAAFGFWIGVNATINLQEEVITSIQNSEMTIVQLNYLNSEYEEGTVSDAFVRAALNEEERPEILEKLNQHTEEYLSNFPNLQWHQRIILSEQTSVTMKEIVTPREFSSQRLVGTQRRPTLTSTHGTSCATIPLPNEGEITLKLAVRNTENSDSQEPYGKEVEDATC